MNACDLEILAEFNEYCKGIKNMYQYDVLFRWKSRVSLVINTIRIWTLFYRNIRIRGLVNIHRTTIVRGLDGGVIELGKRVTASRNSMIASVGGKLRIGDHTIFNTNNNIVCHELIDIGSDCMFGPNVCIYDHDHNFGYEGIQEGFKTGQVIIEDKCWIGANVTILRNTHIGKGCIIGAGAIIKGIIPDHSLVIGKHNVVIKSLKKHEQFTKEENVDTNETTSK